MSDAADDFNQKFDDRAEFEAKKEEAQRIKVDLDLERLKQQQARAKENKEDLEKAKTIDYSQMSAEQIAEIQKDNKEYMQAAKFRLEFVTKTLSVSVPFFRKNLIAFYGKTGEGKSTLVANTILSTITQKSKATGRLGRCFVISNEEEAADIFNRVTCLIHGWNYIEHENFTDEQNAILDRNIAILSRQITIVDKKHATVNGATNTLEGIEYILNNLLENGIHYDAIIIDYFQNITQSKLDSRMEINEVQDRLTVFLDNFKNKYPAPIIITAQTRPMDEAKTPLEHRVFGRKTLLHRATFVMEIVAEREHYRTQWHIWKSRFGGAYVGKNLTTGFDKGKYVEYDTAFQVKVARIKEAKEMAAINKASAIKFNKETGEVINDKNEQKKSD